MGNGQTLINYDPNNHSEDLEFVLNPMSYPNLGIYENKKISLKELIELPLREQAKFSDAIHRRYAKNKIYHQKLLEKERSLSSEEITEVEIGNAAVLSFYNPDSVWTEKYENIRKLIKSDC